MSNKDIMKLTNKLVDALRRCESESLIECVEDIIIKKDKFSEENISTAEDW